MQRACSRKQQRAVQVRVTWWYTLQPQHLDVFETEEDWRWRVGGTLTDVDGERPARSEFLLANENVRSTSSQDTDSVRLLSLLLLLVLFLLLFYLSSANSSSNTFHVFTSLFLFLVSSCGHSYLYSWPPSSFCTVLLALFVLFRLRHLFLSLIIPYITY